MSHITVDLTHIRESMEKPFYVTQDYGAESIRHGDFAAYPTRVENGQSHAASFDLDRHGFTLLSRPTAVPDLEDEDAIASTYYDEVRDLVGTEVGADRVHVIDHTLRRSETRPGVRGPVLHVHNDYTERSLPERLKLHLGDAEAAKLAGRRLVQVNAWRPLTPVRAAPLAIVDGSTVDAADLVAADLVYPDRVGEIYEVKHNPHHKWYYFPDMTPDDVMLIKGYDSQTDGRVRFTPHSAFVNPAAGAGSPVRVSLEVRTIAVI